MIDFEGGPESILMIDQAFTQINRKRPILVELHYPVSGAKDMASIHFYPAINKDTGSREIPDNDKSQKYTRYSPEFPLNTHYRIIFDGPATYNGWRQEQWLHFLKSEWYSNYLAKLINGIENLYKDPVVLKCDAVFKRRLEVMFDDAQHSHVDKLLETSSDEPLICEEKNVYQT